MQLRPGLLGAAAAAMLGAPEAAPAETTWDVDAATLLYSEFDGRVSGIESRLRGGRELDDIRQLSLGATVDVLVGASPNGALPADAPQTFSRPSGKGDYTTQAGDLPLDDTFQDSRLALDVAYLHTFDALRAKATGFISAEYDYLSIALGGVIARDFNLRNTTVSLGINVAQDTLDPVGGPPKALSIMPAPGQPTGRTVRTLEKQVHDLLLSLTQVLSAQSLLQVSYSMSHARGYLTDPYKVLSVVDGQGAPLRYAYEGRPDRRLKQSVYAQYKQLTAGANVLDTSARLMRDDWGLQSLTLDVSFRFNFRPDRYLEPHLRWYRQSAADFYRLALFDGEETALRFATSDQRLGRFDAITLGLKYGGRLRSGNDWNIRLEGYTQIAEIAGLSAQAAQALAARAIEPELDAVMLSAGYRFRWTP